MKHKEQLELAAAERLVPPFLPCWHVRTLQRDGSTQYEVRDSRGMVVAAEVKCHEHARLFAYAPFLFRQFRRLEDVAVQNLWHMLDVNSGFYDVEEIADDVDGEWDEACPGSCGYAMWLMSLDALCEDIGPQRFPPAGVPWQAEIDL